MNLDRAKQLADEHWQYLREVLITHQKEVRYSRNRYSEWED